MIDKNLLDQYAAFMHTSKYKEKADELQSFVNNAWQQHIKNEQNLMHENTRLMSFPTKPSRKELKQMLIDIFKWNENDAEKAVQNPKLDVRD